jgi:vacuolar-type H+-ATPase subunit C/Vma6
MSTNPSIVGTDEAWENGDLGNDDEFVGQLSDHDALAEIELINDSLGLQPISIRLENSLIDDFKAIATIHGLGYQTLMRQALKRFAECEKKQLVQAMAAEIKAKIEEHKVAADRKPTGARSREKKAA